MPHKNNSRKNSRKSTTSQSKPVVVRDDDDYPSIKVVSSKPTSKKTTPKTPRAEFQEPLPVAPMPPALPSPWELMGMTEEDYLERAAKAYKLFQDGMKQCYKESLLADWDDPFYWNSRLESLEHQREDLQVKHGWSAADCSHADELDELMEECWNELDRLEYLYD